MPEHQNSAQENEEPSQFKEVVVDKAQKGIFNNNPLLSTTHVVTCQKCKHIEHIVYLDYLRSGEFEFGKTEQVEILDIQGAISFLDTEKITPIILSLICKRCGCQFKIHPVSVEYLKIIIDRQKIPGIMYV